MSNGSPERVSAVVLGAAGGIGRACVRRLWRDELDVVAVDVDERVRELPDAIPVAGDVTDPATLATAFAACPSRPAVLVHAVLAERLRPLTELSEEDWRFALDVGLVSAWQAGVALRLAAAGRGASMVLIGSVHAHGALAGMATYAVAKAGLVALAQSMAVEWGPEGVRCNVVEPGFVAVERNQARWGDPDVIAAYPLGRQCEPAEVADVVAFLAGPGSSYVNGTRLLVDGGALAVLGPERPR